MTYVSKENNIAKFQLKSIILVLENGDRKEEELYCMPRKNAFAF